MRNPEQNEKGAETFLRNPGKDGEGEWMDAEDLNAMENWKAFQIGFTFGVGFERMRIILSGY